MGFFSQQFPSFFNADLARNRFPLETLILFLLYVSFHKTTLTEWQAKAEHQTEGHVFDLCSGPHRSCVRSMLGSRP